MDSRRDGRSFEPVDAADETRTTTVRSEPETQTETAHYHRKLMPLVLPWLAGAILVPAVLAFATQGNDKPVAPTTPTALPPSAAPSAPVTKASPAAGAPIFQVNQDGKVVTLSGQVPDAATKSAIVAAVTKAYGTGVTVSAQKLTVAAGAPAPAPASLADLAGALKNVGGATLDAQGGQVTLSGVAKTEEAKTALLNAARAAFPGAAVGADGLLVGDPAQAPASCDATAAYVQVVTTQTRIQFNTGGAALTNDSLQALKRVADAVKKCDTVKLLITGNTDNKGTEATNQKLSEQRAAAVKAQLVKYGLKADTLTAQGVGSTKPIASNDTDKGRSLNRRVDITVQ